MEDVLRVKDLHGEEQHDKPVADYFLVESLSVFLCVFEEGR